MTDTKSVRGSFKRINYSEHSNCNSKNYTINEEKSGKFIVSIKQTKPDNTKFLGVKKVNYQQEKTREIYRKINNMLGGS